jgi:dienelactone hydrolase
MLEHGFRDPASIDRAVEDVRRCIDDLRRHPRVDPERIAVWAFSAGGVLLGDVLSAQPSWLRAVAATYAVLDVGEGAPCSSPAPVAVAQARAILVPMLLVRVEHEPDWVAATQDAFLAAARRSHTGSGVEVQEVAGAQHGFETIDDTDEARRAIGASVSWLAAHLASGRAA